MKIDNGVVIGRFQVDALHDGQLDLLNRVKKNSTRMIVILGLAANKCTINNPLDFSARKSMILEIFPEAEVLYIKDVRDDNEWSINLDSIIKDIVGPGQSVVLFGSRDSFISHYSGKYTTQEHQQKVFKSGTQVRKDLSVVPGKSREWRAAVIWAMQNQFTGNNACVDIALFNENYTQILLGRKKDEKKYRFIGGFLGNETLEEAAIRETKEESSVDIVNLKPICSFVINDWRKQSEVNKITSMLYTANYTGVPSPGDDIHELKIFNFNATVMNYIIEEHAPLMDTLLIEYDHRR
jgi:bifunctional NMN adenylyltransferase/nudix hydrolase